MTYIGMDEGTDKKILTQTNTEGTDTVNIQPAAFDLYDVYFDTVMSATTTAGTESLRVNCAGKSKVYFKVEYANSSDTATFVIFYYDSLNEKTVSDSFTVTNTGILDTNRNYYIGEIVEIDTLGFTKTSIYLKTAATGNVLVLGGGNSNDILDCGYVFGGHDGTNSLKDTDEYKSITNTWTSKTDGPLSSNYYCGCNIYYKGYTYIHGNTYSYISDTWTSKTDGLSPDRNAAAIDSILSKMYLVYGYASDNILNTHEYNSNTDIWTAKTDGLSPARRLHNATTINSKLYVTYGYSTTRINDCDEYNPDTWTSKTNGPSPTRYSAAECNINNKAYVVDGNGANNDCDEYNPDTWTSKTSLISPARQRNSMNTIINKGYVSYGNDISTGTTYFKDCDEYNPDTWTSKTDGPSPGRMDNDGISI